MDYEAFLKASAHIQEYGRRKISQNFVGNQPNPTEISNLMLQVRNFMDQQNLLATKIEQFIERQNAINNFVLEKLGNCKCAPGKFETFLAAQAPNSNFESTSSANNQQLDFIVDEKFSIDPDGAHWKPHKCSECGKCFRQKHGLQQHMITHESVGAFFCDVCGKRYTRQESVNRHKRSTPQCNKSLLPQQMLKFQRF
ncbi:unnamed protein product [Caenorhabditis angaria]|uniref:C2H2-type domain-containing protein n=1 Tax=Caenorhabditis angaria TaxID=860376 RepID=A0A9P1MUF5_9PELO|nr:unnamed protein product [Caenorhabditis angaria]